MTSEERNPIYDNVERTDLSPQRNAEPSFAFLNRVGGKYWNQARELHQRWSDHIEDDQDYAAIRSGLRSSDDDQTRSAFLELYLHEVLWASGHPVIVHPQIAGSPRRPDFGMMTGSGTEALIEATVPSRSPAEKASAARGAALLAAIDEVGDPNFFLMTEEITVGTESAPASTVRRQIRAWLAKIDPDTVDSDSPARFVWERDDWRVAIKAMPIRPAARGKPRRSIGVYAHYGVSVIDDVPKIRSALSTKAKAYGNLSSPFVIAVGINAFDEDDDDILSALYGQAAFRLQQQPDGKLEATGFRKPDGFFGVPWAWKHTNVAGVLIVDQLAVHDPTRARVTLWLHPGADHPLPRDLRFPGTVRAFNGVDFDVLPGFEPHALFGLDAEWPEGDPWK